MQPPDCPELEQLAALAEGRLPPVERQALLAHLDRCESCREIVSGALELVEPARGARTFPSWIGRLAAVAAVVTVSVVGWNVLRPGADHVSSLVDAAGTTRVTEARLSGGFAHAPMSATRSADGAAPYRLLAEVGRVEEETRGSERAADLRARALAHLLARRPAEAIPILEALAERGTPDPNVQSDLAAAYLERARRNPTEGDTARALAAADRALAADPRHREALFNRALALEMLQRREDAAAAWDAYLNVDSTSGWAEEARVRKSPRE
jgi:tetratricopeptide (TPR) repeat protein